MAPLFLLLLFLRILATSAAVAVAVAATSASPPPLLNSPPTYQTLVILPLNRSHFDDRRPPFSTLANVTTSAPPPLLLHSDIFHRDTILQPLNHSSAVAFAERLKRDTVRVAAILSAAQKETSGNAAEGPATQVESESPERKDGQRRHGRRHHGRRRQRRDGRSSAGGVGRSNSTSRPLLGGNGGSEGTIGGVVVSGTSLGSGEYLTRIGVGTPPAPALVVLDTGSDLSWVQCAPCGACYEQLGPLFSPAASATYRPVGCGEALCHEEADFSGRCGVAGGCVYGVEYGDGSISEGTLGMETVRFSSSGPVADLVLGCGRDNVGRFSIASGLLGLGGGRLSLPSQLRSDFAYCLPPSANRPGVLLFAPNLTSAAAATPTPLLPSVTSFYTIRLDSVSVAGSPLPIRPLTLIVDSGTTISHLSPSIYAPLRRAFLRASASNLPPARLPPGAIPLFDTCFDLSGMREETSVMVPTLDLHLAAEGSGGAGPTLRLPAENYMVRVDEEMPIYCLAFAQSEGVSILGNTQQQGFLLAFSSESATLSITPAYC